MFYWTLGIVKLPAINCSKNTIIGSAGLGRARRPWRAEPGRVVSRIAAPAPVSVFSVFSAAAINNPLLVS